LRTDGAGLGVGFHPSLHVNAAILQARHRGVTDHEDALDHIPRALGHALRQSAVVLVHIRRHGSPKLGLIALRHLQPSKHMMIDHEVRIHGYKQSNSIDCVMKKYTSDEAKFYFTTISEERCMSWSKHK